MATAIVTSLTNVRARLALVTAQELARRVQFQVIDGEQTGTLLGHPAILEALTAYLGAGKRDCSRWSVWLAPKYRERLRAIKAAGERDSSTKAA